MSKFNNLMKRHLSENIALYSLVIFFLILGVSLGALSVNNINIDTKTEVKSYIEGFLSLSSNGGINATHVLKQSIKFNLYTTLAVYLAGLTILGLLLVPAVCIFRGFCIGFTIGFLTESLGKKGFLLALVSILPQSIIYIPVFIVLAVCSSGLSFAILKNKYQRKHSEMSGNIFVYTFSVLAIFVILLGGCMIEAYITPVFVKLVAPYVM